MTRLTTWKLSDPDVPRTSRQKIGMRRSGFGLIQRTWSGVLKMLKTGQRARSYATGDLEHLLPSEIGSSATQEYPSLIQTFFDTHTVGGVFLRDEDRRLYEEMLRLQGLGTYTDDQIMAMVREGKQRGHIPGVGRVLAGRGKDVLDVPVPRCNHTSDVNELKRSNKQLQKQIDMITKAMSSERSFSHSMRAGVARPGMMSRAMMRTPTRMRRMRIVRRCYIWGKVSTVALNWLTENWVGPYGPHDVVGENCRGMNPPRAFPDYFFTTTCRWGKPSQGACRQGKRAYVLGDSATKRWVDRLAPGTINTWDLLKKAFIQRYFPPSKTAKQLEDIHNFKQEGDESLYQAWERYNDLLYKCPTHDINSHQKVNIFYKGLSTMNHQLLNSQGPIPGMTPAQALTAIQTMADHSQKWHDETTSRNIGSPNSNDGLAALVNKLDNLRRYMKKLKESVHAIQVGC
ncbi:hypothetical protein Tco_1076573 [Tanacetum coccineum]